MTMIKRLAAIGAVLGASAISLPAMATTFGFDEYAGTSYVQVPAGYAGLSWDGLYLLDSTQNGAFPTGVISSPEVIYNTFGQSGTSFSSASAFTFNSAAFGGSGANSAITVLGFVGGVQTYSTSFLVNSAAANFVTFDWQNLSSVQFVTGDYFSLDNLRLNEAVAAVPEAGTWAMMIGGFGAVGFAMRRRRKAALQATCAA